MQTWDIIWKSILLGTVQGLSEFLPVSSSGHLILFQRLLHYDVGGSMTFVNVMLHLGTLFAVLIAMRKEILSLFKRPYKRLFMLLIATVPAGLFGLLLHDAIDALFAGSLYALTGCFLVTAAVLLLCGMCARRKRTRPLGWGSALAMGAAQAVALLPGISRSGSTIAAGTFCGAEREDVANFSFLLSIPVIAGSALLELFNLFRGTAPSSDLAVGVILGVIFAALSGMFAIRQMFKVIRRASYHWFSLYLALLSLFCIWLDTLGVFA